LGAALYPRLNGAKKCPIFSFALPEKRYFWQGGGKNWQGGRKNKPRERKNRPGGRKNRLKKSSARLIFSSALPIFSFSRQRNSSVLPSLFA